jgi:YggT family protein
MFAVSNLLIAIARILGMVLQGYSWILLARVLISWVSPSPLNPIVQFLYRATEPILDPIRRTLPPLGMMDLSPIVAFMAIVFLQSFVVRTLFDIAYQIR